MWLKWHLLNIGLKLKSLLGGLKRTAVDEVNNVSKRDEATIADHGPLHFEREVAERYYDFWDLDFSNMGRMNLYFFLLIVAAVFSVVRFTMGGMDQPIGENYPLMSALGIAVLMFTLFFYELLRKKSDDIPVTQEEYDKAQNWMHFISEKARRSMPLWAWCIVGVGLLLEAGAISIIAASFVSDISKNESMYIGVVLGAIVAAGLGWLIHQAGEGLYREHHRKRLHRVIRNEGGYEKNNDGQYVSETYGALKSDKNDFHTDEEGFLRRHGLLLLACIVIVALATLAFIQRSELNLDIINGHASAASSADVLLDANTDLLMPLEVTNQQQKSSNEALDEKVSHAEKGMYAALGVLTMVFLIINAVGIMFGYRYCFYNQHSEKYFKQIKRFESQRALKAKDKLYATLARQKVLKRSNQFFALFQQYAVKQARREGCDSLKDALNQRGAYKMEHFVESVRPGVTT